MESTLYKVNFIKLTAKHICYKCTFSSLCIPLLMQMSQLHSCVSQSVSVCVVHIYPRHLFRVQICKHLSDHCAGEHTFCNTFLNYCFYVLYCLYWLPLWLERAKIQ